MHRLLFVALLASLTAPQLGFAQPAKIQITVTGGKEDARNVPVLLAMEVPPGMAKDVHVSLKSDAKGQPTIAGQLTAPDLVTETIPLKDRGLVRRDLHFILPELKAGASLSFSLEPAKGADATGEFHWTESKGGQSSGLYRGQRPVLRYMHQAYDNSSEAQRDKTYKVFHHLFDPTGKRLVTNGGQTDPGSDSQKLLYPHHRGLMFAFNKITYANGKKADTWHAKPRDTHQSHEAFLREEEGPVLGRQRVAITWHGPDSDIFAREEREMSVYAVDGGTLVEFASRLKTTGGKVRLDGDPQHAGFQFRAANAVADTAKQTYYLRPDGKGGLGETRNWDPKNKGPVNLPWDAMSFVLSGKRYTVAYIDHPQNPGEKRYSERDYGRFGCYFEYDLTPDHPLLLHHRVWLQEGEMTSDQVQALSTNFVAPPRVTVKSLP
jgi:hypothetical protein